MRNIVVIDDKDHALKQVIYEFPGTNKNDLSFRHFDSIASFRKAGLEDLFIVFLDFFLSKDRDYGTSLIPELKCEHLICFSSMKQASDRMLGAAIEMGPERIRHIYSVQKLKDGLPNEELRRVLAGIFGKNE
jgi:hypothetical protein